MNRNFENRKPTKVYAKSKENQMIIKALNMYGRVPEMWELLKEIERLNNIINELEHHLYQEWLEWKDSDCESIYSRAGEDKAIYDYLQELKESDSNVKD